MNPRGGGDLVDGFAITPHCQHGETGAGAMRDHGFGPVGLSRIIAVTHPDNRASQHVLEKIGMRDEGWGNYYGRRLRLFAIGAPAAA